MAKIAMIGAGSLVFGKTLMSDFLATPALKGSEFRLMATSHTRLDKMEAFVRRMIRDNGCDAKVVATTDRREALKDADYVRWYSEMLRKTDDLLVAWDDMDDYSPLRLSSGSGTYPDPPF